MAKYETPRFQVVKKDGAFQIRHYQGFSTTAVREDQFSGNRGFGVLFGYIGGQNQDKEKIAMTVPVINELEKGRMSMEFIVPSKYQEHIPGPLNPNIEIKHYPPHHAAVLIFSGGVNPDKIQLQVDKLSDRLMDMNIQPKGPFRLARYNSPFSIPKFRHNEIIVEVDWPETT